MKISERCSLAAALPLLSLAIVYALKGGRNPEAFAVAILPLVALPLTKQFQSQPLLRHPTLRPLLFFVLWSVAILVTFPPIYAHLNRLAIFVAYVLFAAAATMWNDRECRLFLGLVIVIGLVEATSFLYLHFREEAWSGHLFGNPIYSALAAATALLALSVFTEEHRNSFLIPAVILLTVSLAFTQSRSTLLGFLVAVAMIAPRRRYLTGLGVLAAAVLIVGILDPQIVLAFVKFDFAHPEKVFGRWTIWKTALTASLDHPIAGWGLGNFESGYLRHQLPIETILHYDRSTIFAHNDVLQLAAETGWVGAAIGIWALVAFARATRNSLDDRLMKWAAATVVLYAVAGIFNFTLFLPYNGFVAAAAFGIGARRVAVEATPGRRWSLVVGGAMAVFLFLFSATNGIAEAFLEHDRPADGARVLPCRSDLWYEAALQTLGAPSEERAAALRQAQTYLTNGLRWNPQDPFAWDRLAIVEMSLPDRAVDPAGAFSRAIDLAPCHAPFWIDAGFERLRAGDLAGCEARFTRASELEPNAPMPWFALAVAAKERGDMRQAHALIDKAAELRDKYGKYVDASGYASYLFGMSPDQMRAAISARQNSGSRKRD